MHTFLLNNNNPALVRNNMVIVVHLQEDVSKTLFFRPAATLQFIVETSLHVE